MKILSFILGTIMGSFYLVLATRLPKGEDIVKSRSRCDNCKYVLKWYNLVPILSFIFQRGKCTKCGKKITLFTERLDNIILSFYNLKETID